MRPSAASSTFASRSSASAVSNANGGGHCGLEIVGVEDRDEGSWECEVGAVINDDFKTKTDNVVLDVKSKQRMISLITHPVELLAGLREEEEASLIEGFRPCGLASCLRKRHAMCCQILLRK